MKKILAIAIFAGIAGCATTLTPIMPDSSVHDISEYGFEKDAVWSAVLGALAEKDFSVTTIEKDEGVIETMETVTSDSRGRKYGLGIEDAEEFRERVKLNIKVAVVRPGTISVQIKVHVQHLARYAYTDDTPVWVDGYSNGKLEEYLFKRINEIVYRSR